jgi:FkbM family methyltransferase
MRVPRRFHILPHVLKNRPPHWPLPWREIWQYLSQPSATRRGQRHVARMEDQDGWRQVRFHRAAGTLVFPASMPLDVLYMVADEIFDPTHWHHYQIPETTVHPGDVVVDCGAAEGLFTLVAAEQGARVFCVEPLPEFVEGLHRTFDTTPGITIFPVAAGARSGTVRFTSDTISSSISSHGDIEARVEPLDSLLGEAADSVTYLKADVEGAELDVVRGAAKLIARHKPRIVLAVYHDPNDHRAIAAELLKLRPDYQIRFKGLAANGHPVVLHAW